MRKQQIRQFVKTTAYAHRLVKLIAAATGESMMAVAERLAADEWERLQGDEPSRVYMVTVAEETADTPPIAAKEQG